MNSKLALGTFVLFLSLLALVACTSDAGESPDTPTAAPAGATPEESLYTVPAAALDVALAFVNEQYGDLAPSPGLHWTGENITPEGLVGAATFRFNAGTCVATVSYPIAAPGAVIYRVIIDDRITDFRWEGDVNSDGRVTELDVRGTVPDDPYVGWRTYYNQKFGYSLRFPGELDMMGVDYDQAITFAGPVIEGENWPWIEVSHLDTEFYRPPEGVDLQTYLLESGVPHDEMAAGLGIAGLPAVRLTSESSPQAYGTDDYYFVKEGQLFRISFLHTGGREDWDLYNRFLASFTFGEGDL